MTSMCFLQNVYVRTGLDGRPVAVSVELEPRLIQALLVLDVHPQPAQIHENVQGLPHVVSSMSLQYHYSMKISFQYSDCHQF